MNDTQYRPQSHGLLIGLLAGTAIGVGLTLWLTPRAASELRRRVAYGAKSVRVRAGEALEDLTERAQAARDELADVVARGAHTVERQAKAAKSGR